jgi:hypothetical protein
VSRVVYHYKVLGTIIYLKISFFTKILITTQRDFFCVKNQSQKLVEMTIELVKKILGMVLQVPWHPLQSNEILRQIDGEQKSSICMLNQLVLIQFRYRILVLDSYQRKYASHYVVKFYFTERVL